METICSFDPRLAKCFDWIRITPHPKVKYHSIFIDNKSTLVEKIPHMRTEKGFI